MRHASGTGARSWLKVNVLSGTEGQERQQRTRTKRTCRWRHAEHKPEEHEKVLSPTFKATESEDEDEDDHRYLDVEEGEDESGGVQVTSPTDRYVGRAGGWRDTDVDALGDRSKCWVEEEGEIFRQETMLLVSEGTVKEHAGKDLRREVGPVPSTIHLLN